MGLHCEIAKQQENSTVCLLCNCLITLLYITKKFLRILKIKPALCFYFHCIYILPYPLLFSPSHTEAMFWFYLEEQYVLQVCANGSFSTVQNACEFPDEDCLKLLRASYNL